MEFNQAIKRTSRLWPRYILPHIGAITSRLKTLNLLKSLRFKNK
jgi:hypothetical protein